MLSVRSERSLERQRADSESTGGSWSSSNGRWPVSEGTVRYDFEEVYETLGDREEYDLEVEFPM
jgi:hypothetical protein